MLRKIGFGSDDKIALGEVRDPQALSSQRGFGGLDCCVSG